MSAPVVALLATRSDGKLRELLPLFASAGVPLESLASAGLTESADEQALEAYDTFELNALAKARWFSRCAPERLVFADDSGLEVDALDGRPGVRSKRWCGRDDVSGPELDEANNLYLLSALDEATARGRAERTARYVCAAACVWPGGEIVARGSCQGTILSIRRGDGGFGYDPLFLSRDLRATFAEVSSAEKQRVGHRGRAFARILAELRGRGRMSGELEDAC